MCQSISEHLLLTFLWQDAIDLEGDALLRYYTAQWTDYQSASQLLNLICHHLNSDWVSRELAYGHMNIHFIYEVGAIFLSSFLFHSLNCTPSSACHSQVAWDCLWSSARQTEQCCTQVDRTWRQRPLHQFWAHQRGGRILW